MFKRSYCFHIPVDPVAKGRPRMTRHGHCFTPAKTRNAEKDIRNIVMFQLGNVKTPVFDGPVEVSIDFIFPRPKSTKRNLHTVKPDLGNCQKLAEDALNGVLWVDDSQIQFMTCQKLYGNSGMIRLKVWSLATREENEKPTNGGKNGKK